MMSLATWTTLLREPEGLALPRWFDAVARRLLLGSRFRVAGVPYRLTEVEFYYHGGDHLDRFSHRDPLQKSLGRWYFHRTRGAYRAGSFKGLDVTFGGP